MRSQSQTRPRQLPAPFIWEGWKFDRLMARAVDAVVTGLF
jgi:hypothetical protein